MDAFKTFGDRLSGSAEAIIDGLFRELAVWADKPRWAGSGFTRLVIELADLPGHPARLIARRHKAMIEGHLADILANAGVGAPRDLAREIWLLSEGAISLMLVHGNRAYAAAGARAAKRKVVRVIGGDPLRGEGSDLSIATGGRHGGSRTGSLERRGRVTPVEQWTLTSGALSKMVR